MTAWDKLLMVLVLAAALGSTWVVRGVAGMARGTEVHVQVDGSVKRKLSLGVDKRLRIKAAEGSLVLEVRDGRARIIKSDCPNHLCETQGSIDEKGGIIACLPYKVIVSVEAPGELVEVDAVAR